MRMLWSNAVLGLLLLLVMACGSSAGPAPTSTSLPPTAERITEAAPTEPDPTATVADAYAAQREELVRNTIVARGVTDPAVVTAMRMVARHLFVPEEYLDHAYADHPLPIGYGQTISQPYIVAVMTELLEVEPDDRVLDVGTGSGYHAAILATLGAHVWSIERHADLSRLAADALARAGIDNVTLAVGDGSRGLPDEAPFDGVVVTCAPEKIPQPLIDQLVVGGRLVIPVGEEHAVQRLMVVTKTESGALRETLMPVRFVPMTGRAEQQQD